MCVIGVALGVHPRWPILIAANRDEFLDRPAAPPRPLGRDVEGQPFFGGMDLARGGTWMGVGASGLFVGLTNQRVIGDDGAPAPRSRGEVVIEALRLRHPEAISQAMRALPTQAYKPFNLMYGSADEGLWVAYVRPDQPVTVEPVPEGVHALPNDALDSPLFPRAARLRRRLRVLLGEAAQPWPDLSEGLVEILSDTTAPSGAEIATLAESGGDIELLKALDSIKIRTEIYGTRSTTLVAMAPGEIAHYGFIDGPPGETPLIDCTPLLHGL